MVMILDLSLSDNIFETNLLSCALQEIEILFDTFNCELLGNPSFGTNFEQYLWALTPTVNDLREYITQKINETTFASQVQHHLEIEYINELYEYAYVVKIYLYTDTESVVKEFKIHERES